MLLAALAVVLLTAAAVVAVDRWWPEPVRPPVVVTPYPMPSPSGGGR
jgi:hypothetical protein